MDKRNRFPVMVKPLAIILLCAVALFANGQAFTDADLAWKGKLATPAAGGGGGGNITAHLWQDYEGALDASGLAANDNFTGGTWTVTGAGSSVGSSAQKAPWFTINTTTDTGSQGLIYDNNTGSGSIQFEPPNYPTTTNVFFMLRLTAQTDSATDAIFAWGETSTTDNICRLTQTRSGSTYTLKLQAGSTGATSSDVTVSINTWYGISVQIVRNGTCSLRVYTDTGTLVGSEVTVTGQDKNLWYHIAPGAAASSTGQREYDNYCLGNVFPLIP